MSKQFVQLFFPTFTSLLSSPDIAPSFLIDVWNTIFPDDVSSLCRLPPPPNNKYTTMYNIIMPRRPCLAMAAITGAIIGMKSDEVVLDRVQFQNGECDRMELVLSIRVAWSKSRTAFGFMNVVAMILHCVIYPQLQQESFLVVAVGNCLWAADCFFTGISCINLILVTLLVYNIENKENWVNRTILKCSRSRRGRLSTIIHASMIVIIAFLSLICQFYHTGKIDLLASASTFIEMMYIVPLISATLFLFPAVFCNDFKIGGVHSNTSILGSRIAIFGGIMVVASVALEKSLCYFITAHAPRIKTNPLLHDIYHMPTLLFLGCDVIFWGLGMWVNSLVFCALEPKKKVI